MKKFKHLLWAALLLVSHVVAAQFSVTFKPNAVVGQDAMIHRNSVCTNWVNTNWGNHPELDAYAWTWYADGCGPGAGRGLVRFDQLNTLPAGAVITYAELRLFGVATSGNSQGNSHYPGSPFANDNSAWVRRITSPWGEGAVTWNTQPAITTVDQVAVPASTTQWNYNVVLNVTNQVIAMMAPTANNGFMLMLQNENYYRSLLFASSDHPDANRWPELFVRYDLPCDANFTYCVSTQAPGLYNFKVDNPQPGFGYSWDFGDGTGGTGTSISHTYATGSYEVCMKAYNQATGASCKTCIKICVTNNVDTTCFVKFRFETENGYLYYFYGIPVGASPVASAEWDFGDGTTSADWPNTKHEYTQSGVYKVCLTVKYENGCVAKYCYEVVVKVPCDVKFDYKTEDGYYFKFEGIPVGPSPVVAATWDFGDGSTASGWTTVDHTYSAPGTYLVCVKVKYENGCEAKFCREVVVGCTVSFTSQTPDGSLYYFTGIPAGPFPVVSAEWDFGDGSPSTAYNTYWPDTKHQYTQAGTYEVCVKVKYANGCVAKYCKTIRVTFVCDVSFNSETADGYLYYFHGVPVGPWPVVSAKWDFGDGTTGSGWSTVKHEYDKPGTYTVCVEVTYSNGCVAKFCKDIKVDCVVDFKFDTNDGKLFYFYGIPLGPYPVSSVEWDFGDGSPITAYNYYWTDTKHEYLAAGTYEVCVTVKYENGCVAKRCYKIDVTSGDCAVKFDYYVNGDVHYFDGIEDGVSGGVISAEWDFGDGSPFTAYNTYWPNTKHIYDRPGTYRVCVTVKYRNGCVARYCKDIVVGNPPKVSGRQLPTATDFIKVLPNPVNVSAIKVSLDVQDAGNYTYTLFNANGKAVRRGNSLLAKGMQQVTVSMAGITPGKYWIEFTNGKKHLRAGFVRL